MNNEDPLSTLLLGIIMVIVGIYQLRKEWKEYGKDLWPIKLNSEFTWALLIVKAWIICIVVGIGMLIRYFAINFL